MHQKIPPQTTSNPTNRDAAVQIGEGPTKEHLILEGVMKSHGGSRLLRSAQPEKCADALSDLAYIITRLTGPHKCLRELAKEEIRKLVKLGKGE